MFNDNKAIKITDYNTDQDKQSWNASPPMASKTTSTPLPSVTSFTCKSGTSTVTTFAIKLAIH